MMAVCYCDLCGMYLAILALWVSHIAAEEGNGMSVRNFKGFPSLQEVECTGSHLDPEVKLLSLKMYSLPERTVLAYSFLNSKECMAYAEYSSCYVDEGDLRRSRLRVLVSDLAEGESREYGCEADRVRYLERTKTSVWSIVVERDRLVARLFKNISSIQEVECWGGALKPEVKLLSLKLYRLSDGSTLGYLNAMTKECITLLEYSSCDIDTANTRDSKLRLLVHDLEEGEGRGYGCVAVSFRSMEETTTWTWTITVSRALRPALGQGSVYSGSRRRLMSEEVCGQYENVLNSLLVLSAFWFRC